MWHSVLERSNFIALTIHETRRDSCAWKQEIHHSGWLCWDEEQIQSAHSLVEPETFIIIITAPFTGLSAFLLWDNSPCDFSYSRLQFTSKWKEDPAEDCLSTHSFFFFPSPAFYYSCSALWGNSGWKQTLLYILPPFQIPALQTADVGSWPQQLFKLSAWSRRRGKSEEKTASSCFQSRVNTGWVPAIARLVTRKTVRRIEERKEGRNNEKWEIMKERKKQTNTIQQLISWFIVGLQCNAIFFIFV